MKKILITLIAAAASLITVHAAGIGEAAPAFTAKNTKGEDVSLADFKDKVVVLEWVNFDCPFVKKHYASGNMQALQEKYTAQGVIWLSVNSSAVGKQGYHDPSAMIEVAAKHGSKASHFLMDTGGKIGKAYNAKVTPHMFIIHKDGNLVYDGAIDSMATTSADDVASADKLFADALDAVLAGKDVANAKNKPYGCGVKY
jgi:peroxiredoxin